MKNIFLKALILGTTCFWISCGSNSTPKYSGPYNAQTGRGPFTGVNIPNQFSADQVSTGKKFFQQKCNSCHNLTEVRLIGPGLKGITQRHEPVWILNYLTNTDDMLDQDPELKKFIDSGLPRMPDQDLTKDDALAVLAFLKNNDGQ